MSNAAQRPTSVWSKIGWLLVIWSASVMALFAAASVVRMFMSTPHQPCRGRRAPRWPNSGR
ncbi:DUF2474 domain-containing protein [Pseudomonas lini]